MQPEKIEQIAGKKEDLIAQFAGLTRTLVELVDQDGQVFDFSRVINGTQDSFSDVQARVVLTAEMVDDLLKSQASPIVPGSLVTRIETGLVALKDAAGAADGRISSISASYGGLSKLDYSNFVATAKNGQQVPLVSELQTLSTRSDDLLSNLLGVAPLIRPRSGYRFGVAAKALSGLIEEGSRVLAGAKASHATSRSSSEKILALEHDASEAAATVQRLRTESDSDRTTISSYLAKVTESAASVDNILDKAKDLETSVDASEDKLAIFDKQLSDRERQFKDGEKKLGDLIDGMAAKDTEIARIIARSEEMLSSATVAGLASNFEGIRASLTTELKAAGQVFYGAIGFLFISAIPLIALIVVPIAKPFIELYWPQIHIIDATAPGSEWQYLGQVLGRVLILVPAAWLVSFTAIRYSSLFRLREHYAYKYSMAVSVEGFQKQAPDYQQEIAAMVLEQLAFNPVDKLVPSREMKEGKAPLFLGVLLERLKLGLAQTHQSEKGGN
ncbi:hypothetical protein [Mesorhizobium dulcispinae]|uniref:hypothetical protein n=1 Tax=Mesorhizobium dulcispinae TaxID=3072316 RepID=UPI002A24B155|nr:hypothetical protein [Mesorhizobium sp. VK23D]MDX8521304.1 hypothetical protein [Mesorhizobium sp. VK23D]